MTTHMRRGHPRDIPLVPSHRPLWFAEPDNDYIEAFKTHVRATGLPETFPGLYYLPVAKSGNITVHADEQIRRVNKAPCPVCWHREQFDRRVILVFLKDLGHFAAIGANCYDKTQMAAAMADYRKTLAEDLAAGRLRELLPRLDSWTNDLNQALKAKKAHDYAVQAFTKNVPSQSSIIRKALAQSQTLSSVIPSAQNGEIDTVIYHGPIHGGAVLEAYYDDKLLEKLHRNAKKHRCDLSAIEDKITAHLSAGNIKKAASELRDIQTKYSDATKRLRALAAFCEKDNINHIDNWSQRLGQVAFRVRIEEGKSRKDLVFSHLSGSLIGVVQITHDAFLFAKSLETD